MANQGNMNEWVIELNKASGVDKENCTEILFLGDIALADQVGDAIQQYGTDFLFKKIPPEFFDVDILCFNLECCLSRRGVVREPKPTSYRGLPEYLSVFPPKKCRYVANVANNHFLDYGEDAANDTLYALRANNMKFIGATAEIIDEQSLVIETDSSNIGLISFAPSVHPLARTSKVNVSTTCIRDMHSQVASLKQKSDIVIVSLHQGIEYTPYVDRCCRNLSRRMVDAGADCVICHHPHVIQGVEVYKGVHIFHSIGNFIIYEDFERRPATRKNLAIKIEICQKKLHKIIINPFIITKTLQPRLATEDEKQQIRAEVKLLSSAFESKTGIITNYLKCQRVKVCDRIFSMYEMILKHGLLETVRYYLNRILAKTLNV